jgi:hypothetical protein
MRQLGRIDVLVCNAASNLFRQFVAPQMLERRASPSIIVSSIGPLRGSSVLGAYWV